MLGIESRLKKSGPQNEIKTILCKLFDNSWRNTVQSINFS